MAGFDVPQCVIPLRCYTYDGLFRCHLYVLSDLTFHPLSCPMRSLKRRDFRSPGGEVLVAEQACPLEASAGVRGDVCDRMSL